MRRELSIRLTTAAMACLALAPRLCAGGARAVGTAAEDKSLILSEITIDCPPGTDGSYVEIYNRSDSVVALAGLQVLCNDFVVATTPEMASLLPKCFVLLQYTRHPYHMKAFRAHKYPSAQICVDLEPVAGPVTSEATGERRPGYVALLGPGSPVVAPVLDYVAWGLSAWTHLHASIRERSRKSGVLPSDPDGPGSTHVAMDAVGGSVRNLSVQAIAQRLCFSLSEQDERFWSPSQREYGTPGHGNRLQPPLLGYLGFASIPGPLKPAISLPLLPNSFRTPLMRREGNYRRFYRAQVAAEPHFEDVLIDVPLPARDASIPLDTLKPGSYFVRVRIDCNGLPTDWSIEQRFTYEPGKVGAEGPRPPPK
jgi:hypothetical protein